MTTTHALWAAIALLFSLIVHAEPDYHYYVVGNPGDVVTETRGLIVMQGGGDDVDYNYQRMGEYSGGGDFVVLRASGADDYNQYILDLCACDSVETIVFENRDAAYDDFVIKKIRNAEAIFIAGGDQSRYVRFWKDTPVEDAIHAVTAKPAPIGGTSAGMAIMGQFTYSAMTESLTSAAALSDPFHADVWLETDFIKLPALHNIITDQHLIERNRIGRTVTLMARLLHDGFTATARAIAADRETSVHVDPATGIAEIFSVKEHETPNVYFLRSTHEADVCAAGEPLSIRGIEVYRVTPGNKFNLRTWTGEGGIAYTLDVNNGVLESSRQDIY
jgi:cyanophycinase-like exopeptidase